MSVGKRLKKLREDKGFTQIFVAEKLGMGRSNLGHIENDRVDLDAKHAKILANLYNTSIEYIYTGEGERFVDPDIRTLNRYAKDLDPEERKRAITMLEAAFGKVFDDDED